MTEYIPYIHKIEHKKKDELEPQYLYIDHLQQEKEDIENIENDDKKEDQSTAIIIELF